VRRAAAFESLNDAPACDVASATSLHGFNWGARTSASRNNRHRSLTRASAQRIRRSPDRVPPCAGTTDGDMRRARGASAPGQRTARGQVLRQVVRPRGTAMNDLRFRAWLKRASTTMRPARCRRVKRSFLDARRMAEPQFRSRRACNSDSRQNAYAN
jgi:hypothetical protein